MGHPVTFTDDDPFLADVRALALALPEAIERVAWGRPTFRAGAKGKIFAIYERAEDTAALLVVKPEPDEQPALLADERFRAPAYWGPSGWVGLDLQAFPIDPDEVAELLESSYRQVALKRQLAELNHTGTDVAEIFSAVTAQLLHDHPTDERAQMLHSPGLRTGGKFYAFATSTDLVVKLSASRVADLVADGRARPCSPRPGRPMREWAAVSAPDEATCLDYVRQARAFVTTR